uniref:Uncharacterized protein n=1 Tax=Oryza glumipatula TaxID=40148 RepID=A0A0E0BSX4_9ORYZ
MEEKIRPAVEIQLREYVRDAAAFTPLQEGVWERAKKLQNIGWAVCDGGDDDNGNDMRGCELIELASCCDVDDDRQLVHIMQIVNIPSFMVRLESEKHIDFSLTSPFGGGPLAE